MAKRFANDNLYKVDEVLGLLRIDVDSDEEDFAESELIIQEAEKDSDGEYDEQEIDDDISSLPRNENLLAAVDTDRSSMAQKSQICSRDGTMWDKEPPNITGRRGRRNIISTKPGTKRFILARVNNEIDVFQELWGQKNIQNILKFTLSEAQRQGDVAFSLSKDELYAFLGLCILRGVLKGRDEPLFHFWNEEYGRPIFRQTMSRNKFKAILRYIRFDDKNS